MILAVKPREFQYKMLNLIIFTDKKNFTGLKWWNLLYVPFARNPGALIVIL